MKPDQIARLLRLYIDPRAKLKDRTEAMDQLVAARAHMTIGDLEAAIKKLMATHRKTHIRLKKCLKELFGAP
jgi:hypothetical protein